MTRMNLLLTLVLIASSLFLVRSAYESRRLFAELDRSRSELRARDSQFKRLEAERQALATHLRVERIARDRLRMKAATAAVTYNVDDMPRGSKP